MKGIKDLFDRLDVKNSGYKVNKYLTNGAFILSLLYMAFIVNLDGLDVLTAKPYVECPADGLSNCVNPFYDEWSCDNIYCESEIIYRGESLGHKPSVYALSFWFICRCLCRRHVGAI